MNTMAPKKRKGIPKKHRKPFYEEYNFEIMVVFLLGLGIFLLVEDLEIKAYLYNMIRTIFLFIEKFIQSFRDGIFYVVGEFETSDLVGISLIFFAMFLVANRWRERMIDRFSSLKECPECRSHLHRIQKTSGQRMTSMFYYVDVKHYSCKSCGYKGIKMTKH